jgi:hypothetical protein
VARGTTALVARLAIVLAIVGVLGTWRSDGPVSLDGLEGPNNGWLVIVLAAFSLVGVRSLARGSWPGVLTVLAAAAVMIYTTVGSMRDGDQVVGGSAGWGAWLTLAASCVLAAVALVAAVRRVTGSTRASTRASL